MKRVIPILIALIMAGCLQQPDVVSTEMRWGSVTSDTTEIFSLIAINNPNSISIPLSDVEIELFMNGVHMGDGGAVGDTNIGASSEDTLTLKSTIENDRLIDWWPTHVKNGEKTEILIKSNLVFSIFGIDFKIPNEQKTSFETSILEGINPGDISIKFAGVEAAKINDIKMEWNVEEVETGINLSMNIENNLPYEIPINYISYRLKMNNIDMSIGEISEIGVVPAQGRLKVTDTIPFDRTKIPEWWVTHIQNDESSKVVIEMEGEIDNGGLTQKISMDTQEFEFHTNIAR